jgi:hypothetical protein
MRHSLTTLRLLVTAAWTTSGCIAVEPLSRSYASLASTDLERRREELLQRLRAPR